MGPQKTAARSACVAARPTAFVLSLGLTTGQRPSLCKYRTRPRAALVALVPPWWPW